MDSSSEGVGAHENEYTLAEVDDLPTALIATGVTPDVFREEKIQEEFKSLFRQFDENCQFEFFRSFKRVRITFETPQKSLMARLHLNEIKFHDYIMTCFFAQTSVDITSDDCHLRLPKLEKQFLISPPASPPVGWEQEHEAAPIVTLELLSRLAGLSACDSPHELFPASDKTPAIVVHVCDDEEDDTGYRMKVKIQHTRRPENL